MKPSLLLWIILLAITSICAYLIVEVNHLKKQVESCQAECKAPIENDTVSKEENEVAKIELVHYMTRIQVFHNKLYFAGEANNTELVEFYLHEIEEEMETIAEAGIAEDGYDISANMKNLGLEQIMSFQKSIGTPAYNFKNSFELLTGTCNSCHTASGHPYLKIITPKAIPFTNQEFAP